MIHRGIKNEERILPFAIKGIFMHIVGLFCIQDISQFTNLHRKSNRYTQKTQLPLWRGFDYYLPAAALVNGIGSNLS